MNVPEMAEIAKKHWRQYHPDSYKELMENGTLNREAEASAELTLMEMETLQKTYGMSSLEAWQESRKLFCLKDPLKQ